MSPDGQNWIDRIGPGSLFIVYAVISLICLSPMFFPFYFKRRSIRLKASVWKPLKTSLSWNKDRI
ncbi:hypothetical protein PGT21_019723 [Puccinia graminis f. sp. tritici]|uniref:Uncharacterized protein n=1 Tax=Puccinia graminis f. sp. tritici TaxID=56615 RepID=A0A5B0MJE3_PUCGR|nr:hypothetical protein PGT21_019723 [Puccinia graminis f. sp. tritici]